MLRPPNDVQYFTAVMYNTAVITEPDAIIEGIFGKCVYKSAVFNFDHTTYYEPEMGGELKKYFYAFEKPMEPAFLAKYKLAAIAKEDELAVQNKRIINIDPGYLALEKVVVASTKNFTHRIYLSDGIFGDLQLMRQKKIAGEREYKGLPWTYADYLRTEAMDFFENLKKIMSK